MTARPRFVYMIEDDDDGRLATQMLLELSGWTVPTYRTAEAFLEELKTLEPGCLLVDFRMPGISGMQQIGRAHV